jgi:hypothetical protein
MSETSRVLFFPRFLRQKKIDPAEEGQKELEVQYQVYQLLRPLSHEARHRVVKHCMVIFAEHNGYVFEDQ